MFVLIFTEHATVHFCLPNKSHKLLLGLMYSDILNAIVSFIFFSTEEDLTLTMEIAPNVIESQQPKNPSSTECHWQYYGTWTDEQDVKLRGCSRSWKKSPEWRTEACAGW